MTAIDTTVVWFLVILILAASMLGVLLALKSRQFGTSVGFATLGAVVGLLVGMSETAVVSPVIGAILTFLGGIVGYLFLGKNVDRATRSSIGNLILAFSVLMIIGVAFGVTLRAELGFSVEGLSGTYRLYVTANETVENLLITQPDERNAILFQGKIVKNGEAHWFGEMFEVSWPGTEAGTCDALTVKVGRLRDKELRSLNTENDAAPCEYSFP